jgi:hypothetical protein
MNKDETIIFRKYSWSIPKHVVKRVIFHVCLHLLGCLLSTTLDMDLLVDSSRKISWISDKLLSDLQNVETDLRLYQVKITEYIHTYMYTYIHT